MALGRGVEWGTSVKTRLSGDYNFGFYQNIIEPFCGSTFPILNKKIRHRCEYEISTVMSLGKTSRINPSTYFIHIMNVRRIILNLYPLEAWGRLDIAVVTIKYIFA